MREINAKRLDECQALRYINEIYQSDAHCSLTPSEAVYGESNSNLYPSIAPVRCIFDNLGYHIRAKDLICFFCCLPL